LAVAVVVVDVLLSSSSCCYLDVKKGVAGRLKGLKVCLT
jgi:hypothetical protein